MGSIIEAIVQERQRQIDKEGWSLEHDDEHVNGELAEAAAAYASAQLGHDLLWPWEEGFPLKPTTRRQDLIKAAALIVAEIEKLYDCLDEPKEG